MGADSAKALVAKVMSDEKLAKQLNEAKTEKEFLDAIAKLGYTDVSPAEFGEAFKSYKADLSDEELDQAAGGLSMVGVDFAFTVAMTVKHPS